MFQMLHTTLKAQTEAFEGFSLNKNKTFPEARETGLNVAPRSVVCGWQT